jgi:hypothetical protein
MVYIKPEVLDTRNAQECVKGQDKAIDLDDNGNHHVVGTAAAYEADE